MSIYNQVNKPVLRRPVEPEQYVALIFGQRLRKAGIAQSMGSKGDCFDNAVCESFHATLEKELLRGRSFKTRQDAKTEALCGNASQAFPLVGPVFARDRSGGLLEIGEDVVGARGDLAREGERGGWRAATLLGARVKSVVGARSAPGVVGRLGDRPSGARVSLAWRAGRAGAGRLSRSRRRRGRSGARPGGHGGSGSPRRARRGSAPPARGRRRRSRRAPAGAGRCEPSRRSCVSRSSICSSSAWMIVSIASTLARAGSGNTSARCPTVAPRRSNSRPRPQGQPSWVSSACQRCAQRLRS